MRPVAFAAAPPLSFPLWSPSRPSPARAHTHTHTHTRPTHCRAPQLHMGDVIDIFPFEGVVKRHGTDEVVSTFELKTNVLLDEVRAGGRIPLIIGRGLTDRARESLGLPASDVFQRPPEMEARGSVGTRHDRPRRSSAALRFGTRVYSHVPFPPSREVATLSHRFRVHFVPRPCRLPHGHPPRTLPFEDRVGHVRRSRRSPPAPPPACFVPTAHAPSPASLPRAPQGAKGYTLAQKMVGKACGVAGVMPEQYCEPKMTTVGSQDTTGPMTRDELKDLACLGFSADLVMQSFCHTAAYPKPVDVTTHHTLPDFIMNRGGVSLRPVGVALGTP